MLKHLADKFREVIVGIKMIKSMTPEDDPVKHGGIKLSILSKIQRVYF